jgi:excisionase family DNA binding protein
MSSRFRIAESRVPFNQRLTCTVLEACQAIGVGRTKLYELIGCGKLCTTTIGRRRLVVVASLLSLVPVQPERILTENVRAENGHESA